MANNVLFLQGQEEDLNTKIMSEVNYSEVNGRFYFIDGHNLYIGIRQDIADENSIGSFQLLNNRINIAEEEETTPYEISHVHYDEYWYLPVTKELWHCNGVNEKETRGEVGSQSTKQWELIFAFPRDFSIGLDENGQIIISYKEGDQDVEVKSDEKIYTQEQINEMLQDLQNQIDSLNSDMDSRFNGLDGMTFKGAIPDDGLPEENVCVGDTYIVIFDGTYNGQAAVVEDLFIATGTENEEGYITSETLAWTYVPSGNDTYWEPFEKAIM